MSNWIDVWSVEESKKFLSEVSGVLSDLGGPLTRDLSSTLQAGRLIDLVNYQFDYDAGYAPRDYLLARQVHALYQKQEWTDLGLKPRERAEAKFWEMEKKCFDTNVTLDNRLLSADVWPIIHRARREIDYILGNVPLLSSLKFSFGPGATTNVKGRVASPRAKLNARLACSQDMLPVVGCFLAEAPQWVWSSTGLSADDLGNLTAEELVMFPEIEIHPGKLSFVPKDARIERPIVVEPILNGFAQLGIGSYMKGRLLSTVRLDLTDQSRNQRLAMEGSEGGVYATIDLSSASDTVSWSVVSLLVPEPWFDFLAGFRTGDVSVKGKAVELNKFSSMGNGFTFELESLLFYSLAKSTCSYLDLEGDVSVFGDDIVCHSQAVGLLTKVLTELGFLVNNEKSFSAGPFRESCGADWFKGKMIRPYYGKKPWCERTLYTFHNFAVRNCEHELASFLLSKTNPTMRLFGPDGYGDGHLIGSYSLRTNRRLRRCGWGGGFFDTYSLKPRRLKKRYAADWVYPSYSVYTRSGELLETDPDIVRGSSGYAKVSLYTLASTVFSR